MKIAKLHHVGTVVRDLDKAVAFYQEIFGARLIKKEFLPIEQELSAFMLVGDTIVELMQPTDPNLPLGKFLEAHGEGIFSIGLRVSDFQQAKGHFRSKGLRVIGEQAEPFPYAFLHPKDTLGVMVEFSEYGRKEDPLALVEKGKSKG